MRKRMTAFLIIVVMVAALCPMTANAAGSSIYIGDIVTFGTYEQDGNRQNGEEPIEWIVLDTDGDYIFVVSRYVLDRQRYNKEKESTTWESSDLRAWLNYDFYNSAFSTSEQAAISATELYNEDNPQNGASGGRDTEDMIFILSESEVEYYMEDKADRKCKATKYAAKQGVTVSKDTGGAWWTMRTPGIYTSYVCYVSSGGGIHTDGQDVNSGKLGVRPAMWIYNG